MLLVATQQLSAQYKIEQAILLNKEIGLPSNDIRQITKSEDGFIWIGTREGLCRFDGLQFYNYKPEEGNPHTIFSKDITAIVSDKKDLWLGTSMGVSVFDIYTGKFRNYQFNGKGKTDSVVKRPGMEVSSLCKDKNGDIWIGTRHFGVCKYDRKKDDFVFYPYIAPDTLAPAGYNTILSLDYSRKNDSIIFGGTIAGLVEINKYSGVVKRYYFQMNGDPNFRHANAFRRIYYHDDGMVYAGTWRAGVNVYNPYDHTLKSVLGRDQANEEIMQGAVSSVIRKSEHEIWITTSMGLLAYNTATSQVSFRKVNKLLE